MIIVYNTLEDVILKSTSVFILLLPDFEMTNSTHKTRCLNDTSTVKATAGSLGIRG